MVCAPKLKAELFSMMSKAMAHRSDNPLSCPCWPSSNITPERSGYLWPLLPKDAWASEIDSHLTPASLSLDNKFLEGWDHIHWHLSALPGMPSTEGTWEFMKALRTLGIFTENVKCAIVENSNWPNSPVEYTGTEPSFVFPHKTIPWSELYKKSYFTDTQRIRFVGESYGEAWVYHLQFQGLRAPEKSLSPSPQAHYTKRAILQTLRELGL